MVAFLSSKQQRRQLALLIRNYYDFLFTASTEKHTHNHHSISTSEAMFTSAPLATRMETHSWWPFLAANIRAVNSPCSSETIRNKFHFIDRKRFTQQQFNYLRSHVYISAIGHKNGNTFVATFYSSEYQSRQFTLLTRNDKYKLSISSCELVSCH